MKCMYQNHVVPNTLQEVTSTSADTATPETKRWKAKEEMDASTQKKWTATLSAIGALSGPVLRDTARLSQAIPPYCALWGFWCLNMANWVWYPLPPFLSVSTLESMRSGGAIPPLKRGISAIPARYPKKTRQEGAIPPSAILSRKGVARYGGGISHWAAKGANSSCPRIQTDIRCVIKIALMARETWCDFHVKSSRPRESFVRRRFGMKSLLWNLREFNGNLGEIKGNLRGSSREFKEYWETQANLRKIKGNSGNNGSGAFWQPSATRRHKCGHSDPRISKRQPDNKFPGMRVTHTRLQVPSDTKLLLTKNYSKILFLKNYESHA